MADELDFQAVDSPKGGKVNPLKKLIAAIKKNPAIGFVLVGAVLGLFWFFRRQRSAAETETVTQVAPSEPATVITSGGGSSDTGTAMADILGLYAQANEQRFGNLEQTIEGYASQTSQGFSALQESIGNLADATSTRFSQISLGTPTDSATSTTPTQTPSVNQPIGSNRETGGVVSTVNSLFDQQVAAYKQIEGLKTSWANIEAAEKAGTLTKAAGDAQQALIHQQAEAISIGAGFGSGGDSGAARIIPEAVKIAAAGG